MELFLSKARQIIRVPLQSAPTRSLPSPVLTLAAARSAFFFLLPCTFFNLKNSSRSSSSSSPCRVGSTGEIKPGSLKLHWGRPATRSLQLQAGSSITHVTQLLEKCPLVQSDDNHLDVCDGVFQLWLHNMLERIHTAVGGLDGLVQGQEGSLQTCQLDEKLHRR